jgi:hypothetical protein
LEREEFLEAEEAKMRIEKLRSQENIMKREKLDSEDK